MKIDIKELLTLPTYILAAIAIASGIILFLPENFINQIYMASFRNRYGFIIGITFLVSVSILIINFGIWLFKQLWYLRLEKKFYEVGETRLNSLNDYQKTIIYGLYQKDNRTALLPLFDGAIKELETQKMVGKISTTQMVDMADPRIPYMIQPWVVQKLDESQELRASFYDTFENYK